MSDYLGLDGCRALVTGGTKGIGAAVAERLREARATVLVTARSKSKFSVLTIFSSRRTSRPQKDVRPSRMP